MNGTDPVRNGAGFELNEKLDKGRSLNDNYNIEGLWSDFIDSLSFNSESFIICLSSFWFLASSM